MMQDLTYRGLTLWDPFWLQSVEGLDGGTVRDGADRDQPRGDGGLPGAHYLEPRHVTLGVQVEGRDNLPRLFAAFQPSRRTEHPLTWTSADGDPRMIYARVIGGPVQDRPGPLVPVPISMKASDPRIYGTRHVVRVRPYAVVEGGLDYPVDYPKDYGADEATTAIATNAGDSDSHPTVRIHGPASGATTSWRLRNTTNGSSVRVDTAVGPGQLLTVRLREWVVADPAALIVELDGASRYGDWTTRPEVLWLSPGDNVLRLEVLAGDLPSAAEIIYRDTFAGTRRENQE